MHRAEDDETEATLWAVRLDDRRLTDLEDRALARWLGGDRRRHGALLRARAGLALLDGDRSPTTATAPASVSVSAPPMHPPARRVEARRSWLPAVTGLAAAVALLFVADPLRAPLRHSTSLGEIETVVLSDGTRAVLNSDSMVVPGYADERRLVTLERGEAWFDVVPDSRRPFMVMADGVRVQAVGTAFAVRSDDVGVRIAVTEGAVMLWSEASPMRRYRVGAGKGIVLRKNGTAAVAAAPARLSSADDLLAWRQREIVLKGTDVAEAVRQFNSHNALKIRLGRRAIAITSMDGLFKLDRPQDFARAVAYLTGSTIHVTGNEIEIR